MHDDRDWASIEAEAQNWHQSDGKKTALAGAMANEVEYDEGDWNSVFSSVAQTTTSSNGEYPQPPQFSDPRQPLQPRDPPQKAEDPYKPTLVRACDIPHEPPRWGIKPLIQMCKGTLFQADAGVGKTALLCCITAHITTGKPILDMQIQTPGIVLIFSVEDDLPVLRGRIEANGGDLSKCHFMTNVAGLTFNSPEVEQAIKETGAVFVWFDPYQAFLGATVDMNKSNQTRPEFAKLFEMASKTGVAIGIVAHIGKGSITSSAVNRSLGSVDLPAAMRSVVHIVRDTENDDLCVAVHVKCSNASRGKSMAYTIGDRGGVTWQGYHKMTVADLGVITKRKESSIPYENEPLV